jgi:hypothetical protein
VENAILWDVKSRDSCKNQLSRGTYHLHHQELPVTASIVPSLLILFALMMEVTVPPKIRFLQEPHGVISLKAEFFMRCKISINLIINSNGTYN